jgi:uncharacterized protein YyaL (SSP411 family)
MVIFMAHETMSPDGAAQREDGRMANQLGAETSPYLLQHRDNPVHWRPWGEAAFAEARDTGRPVLLSVGYAACHWCHVMAHESFEDEAIAALMNQLFVSIKVDREERPDVDAIYQQALALTGQQGGWPLTMFLDADGEPFWGGTYFPPEPRWGRPGFPDILRRVAEIYREQPETVAKNRTALGEALARLSAPREQAVQLSPDVLDQVARALLRNVDMVHGGIGGAPKFPQCSAFELLWRAHLRTGEKPFREAVETTLDAMCQGGVYDHLGGGFARYSTDEKWLVPHFEKMLYDNAQLLELLTLTWQGTDARLYEVRARETVEWALREMIAEGGAFAATYDADSEGEEGRFYVWTAPEVDRLLGADADAFKRAYDVSPGGNWEDRTILNRSHAPELRPADEEAELARMRKALLDARSRRVWPGWDDKVLADWNGLMIAALARAARAFGEPVWLEAAERAFAFVQQNMQVGGRLRHSWRAGKLNPAGMLDDYAQMARAALALYEARGMAEYLVAAEAWTDVLNRHYWDERHGGYFFTADDASDLITRQRQCHDNATPAGNAVMAGVLTRLWLLTGNEAHRKRAEAVFDAFSGEVAENFFPLCTLLNSAELTMAATQIAIVGRRGEPETEALIDAAFSASLPNRVLQVVEPGAGLPPAHPASGKAQTEGRATAYVCLGPVCSLPLHTPAALRTALSNQKLKH